MVRIEENISRPSPIHNSGNVMLTTIRDDPLPVRGGAVVGHDAGLRWGPLFLFFRDGSLRDLGARNGKSLNNYQTDNKDPGTFPPNSLHFFLLEQVSKAKLNGRSQ